MKVERVRFGAMGAHFPPIALAYLEDYAKVASRFDVDYRDEKSRLARAREALKRPLDPAIGATLERRMSELKAPAASMAALAKLRKGAVAVVTGQQPAVALGPLYNIYKALTAIRLARSIDEAGVPAVAVFWNHSDDHHPGELGRIRYPGQDGGMVDFTVPLRDDDAPLYTRSVDAVEATLAGQGLKVLPHGASLMRELGGSAASSLSDSFSRLLLMLLGRHGLIVVEPRDLVGATVNRVLLEAIGRPTLVDDAVAAGGRALGALGFKPPLVGPFGTNVYTLVNGRRVRAVAPAVQLSAGVAMRLIVQDAVLPTAAYVGGPNEVGYIGQLKELYSAFGMSMPTIVPRMSATLVEQRVGRSAERMGLSGADLFRGEAALAERIASRNSRFVIDEVGRASQELESRLRAIEPELERIEKPLIDSARKAAGKSRLVLEALQRKIVDAQKQADEVGRAHARKIATHLTPGGVLQERIVTPLYYLAMIGPTLIDELLASLDPTAFEHQVVSL